MMDDKLKQPYQGHLIKFTNVVKGWQSRWFILDPEHGNLQYYLSEGDRNEKARGVMNLVGAVISPSFEDSQTFTVSPADGESYKLRAQDTKDRQMWINRLRLVAEMHTKAIVLHYPTLGPREALGRDSHAMPSGRLGGLDVLDAFTQVAELMEETQRQHSALAQSIEELPSYGSGIKCLDPNVLLIKATSQATLSCLDECLCALRSRHTAVHSNASQANISSHHSRATVSLSPLVSPLLGGRSPRSYRRNASRSLRRRSKSPRPSVIAPFNSSKPSTAPQSPTPSAMAGGMTTTLPVPSERRSNTVDCRSLSASQINCMQENNLSLRNRFKMYSDSLHSSETSQNEDSPSSTPINSNFESLDNQSSLATDVCSASEVSDADEGLEADGEPVEEGQRSVLMHIISQLRLGMDLTRVTLPTVILEKRSLLEMFADFLGHPDLFLRISEEVTAENRMIAVVRWYLTSIHVGRQGSIAKKPYNPIIGENFYCSWRVPAHVLKQLNHSVPLDQSFYTITYRSEQVSHHPPVSAFFFECSELEMCINAHIWTKSKFMGMSIGVNLIGNIHLVLGKFSETYHLSMPSAYARSVLMEPWVELGGRVDIHCPQTEYSAPIIFHTKPFYGGKLHKVTCEVKDPEHHIICRVQGEWDSHLQFLYEGDKQETINISDLSLCYRKRVRPINRQASNESRNLWYDVTKALSVSDLVTATNHKKSLEDRQRAEEQQRLSTNSTFEPKLFSSPAPDQWVYNYLPKYALNAIPIGTPNVALS